MSKDEERALAQGGTVAEVVNDAKPAELATLL
jgi:hypothetical protein